MDADLATNRLPWLPYLIDRADGVKGRYAIARWNPKGYREVWNMHSHCWSSASEEPISLDEANDLLSRITIPTDRLAERKYEVSEARYWMEVSVGYAQELSGMRNSYLHPLQINGVTLDELEDRISEGYNPSVATLLDMIHLVRSIMMAGERSAEGGQ